MIRSVTAVISISIGALMVFSAMLTAQEHRHGAASDGHDRSAEHAKAHPAPHVGGSHSAQDRHAGSGSDGPLKQTNCPVMGEPIDHKVFVEHEGRKVYFCCKGCDKKFEDSPRKYLPALYEQIFPQSVQVKCPVMGGTVNPDVFVDHDGQRVHFCCKGCDAKFEAEPDKYAKAMSAVTTDQVHCPVTGKPISPKHSIELGGKTVYFCSKACAPKLQADLRKYTAKLRPEAGLLAHGATAEEDLLLCPVCLPEGGIHKRPEVEAIVHNGVTYAMCNSSCTEAFKADPEKYTTVLRKEMVRRAGKDQKLYTCSMHPSIIQKNPGTCPICAMKLTPVKPDK